MIRRGQVWRADLGIPRGASPGYERPVVVIQSDTFNKTNIDSVIVAAQLFTIDKEDLIEFWGQLPSDTVTQIDAGLRLVLHLKEN